MQINARAAYSLSYGGTCPDLLLLEEKSRLLDTETSLSEHKISKSSNSMEWTLLLPKAYHPLLVQQHRLNLRKARKDLSSAAAVSHGMACKRSHYFSAYDNSL